MKKKIYVVNAKQERVEKQINYIPVRYIISILLSIIETVSVIGIVVLLTTYFPLFSILVLITSVVVIISIVNSEDNPDYKVPWLLVVVFLPIVGFMLYFMFYRRKLSHKLIKKLKKIDDIKIENNKETLKKLKKIDPLIYSHAHQICEISNTNIYQNTKSIYFNSGESAFKSIIEDLKKAEKFIFLEFFIIEDGKIWNEILEVLKEKTAQGVEVKMIYDDIGCMNTLPGNYYKSLKKFKIDCVLFSKLKPQANSEFNNRSHRKILVIDGIIGYTGGINLADEYANIVVKYGHWKDVAIKITGEAVVEMSKLFLDDFLLNSKEVDIDFNRYTNTFKEEDNSFVIPFGDGPNPIYKKRVGKTIIMNLLAQATNYVYITTPYLIIDNELFQAIENCALRDVDVRIITPHIPDKKAVFWISRESYKRLIKANVKIYEYEPGFIHAKTYISDDKCAMIGTINLDYRSLVHHFENGIWLYNSDTILDMKKDFFETLDKSIFMNETKVKEPLILKIMKQIIKVFSPLL